MKLNQLKSIHKWIRTAETSEILFVTALILPAYVLIYNFAIIQINENWKNEALIIAIVLYIGGVIWMKNSQSQDEKNLKDLLVIKNYVLDKGFKFMSFEKLLELHEKFTEERVRALIFVFPNDLRLAKLKEGKKGIKILNIDLEQE